jgi:ERCC4-type nuclease
MIVKIDTREQGLYFTCGNTIANNPKFTNIQLIYETLPLGDIIINDGINDCIIIERKTVRDLAASITDGRYEEQSYRLNGLPFHNHNIIYLIEGDIFHLNPFKERMDRQTLYSAIFSINYFKGFSVIRTHNLEETALVICNMVYKLVTGLKNGKKEFYSNINNNLTHITDTNTTNTDTNTNTTNPTTQMLTTQKQNQTIPSEKDYCSVIKKVKKDNITKENIGEIMLCQIPGVSFTTALAILSKYKTLTNLITSIKDDKSCLNDICTIDANGKSRKISQTTIATIISFLH